uniref:Uncharacterized protein n=1 Tax=Rhizophora mucronata TaxID=61149 RepID=A0A2P2QY49_RHIMU
MAVLLIASRPNQPWIGVQEKELRWVLQGDYCTCTNNVTPR